MRWSKSITALALCGAFLASDTAPALAGDITRVNGRVIFKGKPEQFRRFVIDTSKDPACKVGAMVTGTLDVVLNTETSPTTISHVLVSVSRKHDFGTTLFPTPQQPVTLTQKRCQFIPHVVGVVKNQPLELVGNGLTDFAVSFQSKVNKGQTFKLAKGVQETKTVKLEPEPPFEVRCELHPWMKGYIAVFDHPFFSVTGEEGEYELKGMPPGKYVIEAWHEKFGTLAKEVDVVKGETITHDFVFDLSENE
ncbi:MAG: hypothetical protein JSU63_16985 [Phycisphaerales bacterium]|nr:MAG: hypothetical protein JSU63_16985 [Phycisphaerales bacterium]